MDVQNSGRDEGGNFGIVKKNRQLAPNWRQQKVTFASKFEQNHVRKQPVQMKNLQKKKKRSYDKIKAVMFLVPFPEFVGHKRILTKAL